MKLTNNSGLALLLIALGGLMLLGKIGFGLGHLMGYLIPIAMIGFGYMGVKSGKSLLGWGLILFGALLLMGKMSALIGWAIAIGLIFWGVTMLKRGSAAE